jgi:hypothetical protein
MKKLHLSRFFLFASILTAFSIFAYISYKSYDNLFSQSATISSNTSLKPFDSSLNTSVLDKIKNRKQYQTP